MESSNEFLNRLKSSSFAKGGICIPSELELLNFEQDQYDLISKCSQNTHINQINQYDYLKCVQEMKTDRSKYRSAETAKYK